ncbi:peroxidase 2-like [Typha latifolia]|uniref:peroxidase 2-like n=1 Tax=Typha latifolia TaxID=4733 RepID=UPI003C2B8326
MSRSVGRAEVPLLFSCLVFAIAFQAMLPIISANPQLQVGFYKYKCPKVEKIVRKVVHKAVAQNPGIGAGLIRMFFHDCFVRGCDASVLLDPTAANPNTEKTGPPNNPSLRGFEVIDDAKAAVEHHCPGTVSCADIIAFAARDAADFLGVVRYSIPSGRRDGRVSVANETTQNLPPPIFNLTQLKASFASKGLSVDDLVTLSGAHSIGHSLCSSFSRRLFNFSATQKQDPSMDPSFAAFLKTRCPSTGSLDPTVDQDIVTPNKLDNQYYKNVNAHRVLFSSDQTLLTSGETAALVATNAKRPGTWQFKFGAAMIKMGNVEVLTGNQGEIRKSCRFVN